MKILLIEPDYHNKYPPLGLMKISAYHRQKGDFVKFYKGESAQVRDEHKWDRIYISSLFTFHWNKTVRTIKFYLRGAIEPENVFVGGVMAHLLYDDLKKVVGNVKIVKGILDENGKIGFDDDGIIDSLPPDYSIITPCEDRPWFDYKYRVADAYFVHATRGCPNKCDFCAVPIIEGKFQNGNSIIEQVEDVRAEYGEKRNLLLMDNNILESSHFEDIIAEIKESGFEKGAKLESETNGRKVYLKRIVDFNQGVDATRLDKRKAELISQIAIQPLRIAFDHIELEDTYKKAVWLSADAGIEVLSNYVLFNYKDTPEGFYRRLEINIELNNEFEKRGYKTRIWSFPMRYSPVLGEHCKDRKFIGKHWNPKFIRGIQCVLLATHGVVGPQENFFRKAFGRDYEEFQKILLSPEAYIIWRKKNQARYQFHWKQIESLSPLEKESIIEFAKANRFNRVDEIFDDHKLLRIAKRYLRKSKDD